MPRLALGAAALTALALLVSAPSSFGAASLAATTPAPVTITEDEQTYTLSNGLVSAMVAKASGDLVSLKYNGLEMLASYLRPDGQPDLERDPPGANPKGLNSFGDDPFSDHQYGFWSHDAMGPLNSEEKAVAKITIDPKANGGERAEVSIKGISNGRRMGTGPGSNMRGNFISDIEIRFAMDRSLAGVYTYCVFEHKPEYPASTITEARFCFKLNDFFDWMLVDDTPHRNKLYPPDLRENKYFYTTVQFDNRAFGWASTTNNVGCFLLNPSMEYMSGGPTKVEFLCHRDTGRPVYAPTVLNYWRSSHYGGAGVSVAEGEHWTKVIGPFLIYCNSGASTEEMFKNARAEQVKQEAKWPYAWVDGVDYPKKSERGVVAGRLVLNDPFVPDAKFSRALVGLTVPDQPGGPGQRGLTWQNDAKNYQFWARTDADGKFNIQNVRPGTYELHAIADGVLGEYRRANVTVEAGKSLDLGKVEWEPMHYGSVVWEIGVPNRNPSEFFKGNDYFHNGMDLAYAEYFPNDVRYVVGKSDFSKDWYYMHIPRASAEIVAAAAARRGGPAGPLPGERANAPAAGAGTPRGGGRGGPAPTGPATPWTIEFDMPQGGKGTAVLRIALARTATGNIAVGVNGEPTTAFTNLVGDGSLGGTGVGIQGLWREYAVSLDATKFKQGTNTITLTVPPGALTSGVNYDYLRLEMNENAPFPQTAPQ